MRVGITYDLKAEAAHDGPDDLQEEYDSPATVEAIAAALRGLGHEVAMLGDGRELLQQLLARPPEFVFNFAEGQGISRAREARVPAVLEMLGIPYTGSDPLTLAVTLDKDCAKTLVQAAGVPVPRGVVVRSGQDPALVLRPAHLSFPVIAKPAWEGSSKGIRSKCLVDRLEDLPAVVESLRGDYRQPVLVEEFIEGEEVTVGMLGNDPPQVLGAMRVIPVFQQERFVYSLEVKRDFRRQVRYECPAELPPGGTERLHQAALDAWTALGCRDVARIDFRVRDGLPYFLEVNPLPGLSPGTSDLVIMAEIRGWSYARLVETIFRTAVARHAASASR